MKNWLFIRGLCRNQFHWNDFPQQFTNFFPESTVHFLDLPGFGLEINTAAYFSLNKTVGHVRNKWLALQKTSDEPWGILSISLGSMVATSWVSQHPQDFKKLILINPSSANLDLATQRLRVQNLGQLLKTFGRNNFHQKEKMILDLTTNLLTPSTKEAIVWQWTQIQEQYPMKLRNILAQLAVAAQFQAPQGLPLDSVIFASAADRLVDPSCSVRLSRHANIPLKIHPQAGHDLPLDDPDWLLLEIRDWLRSSKLNLL